MSAFPLFSEMQTPTLGSHFALAPHGKVPGRKRGRPPVRKFQNQYLESLLPLNIPKKRGRKPGFKLRPRMLTPPRADSPPNSTPEPEMGSIPQEAAIVPHSAAPQVLTGQTSVPEEDFLCVSTDFKRYAVDSSDPPFHPPKRFCGHRGNRSYPTPLRKQPSSPERFQEANRNACFTAQDSSKSVQPSEKDPSSWSVEEVVWFIKDADPQSLGPHAETFRKHEIDGDALLLLKSEMMMKYLGLKLGPALKLCFHIDRLKQNQP